MSAPLAIVTDGLWRKSMCAIRALGAAGYRVCVIGDSHLTTGFYSRYTTRRFRGPPAATDGKGFGQALRRAVAAGQGQPVTILPMEDATIQWLLEDGHQLPAEARWLLPDKSSFELAGDKALTLAKAQELGLPAPRTETPDSPQALSELLPGRNLESLVLKPRRGTGSAGIVYGRAIGELALAEHWARHGPLLLQERIPADGEAIGVSLLYDREARPRAAFAYRRLREYPVTGGPSTQRISIACDKLVDYSKRLLSALNWRGVAMVEWKLGRDGRPMLLEINPRFWGSLALSVKAGVNFPVLYADAVRGARLQERPPAYEEGVVSRWLVPGDILRYLNSPPGQRESVRDFLNGALSDSEEIDGSDLPGSLACFVCQLLLAGNPKYWRYLRR